MDNNIKKKLASLHRLATHEATPEHEKASAEKFLRKLMKLHGVSDVSEFLDDMKESDTDDSWVNYEFKLNNFSRNIAAIVAKFNEDIVIFTRNGLLCKKDSTVKLIKGILDRYDYHVINMASLLKTRSNKSDYSHGFAFGVMSYFEEQKEDESANDSNEDNSNKLAIVNNSLTPINDSLTRIGKDHFSPVPDKDMAMGKITDQRLFMIGMMHGKNWKLALLES